MNINESVLFVGKTEYIRNLLHDSANITVPLRRNGTTPRNHFNHNKGLDGLLYCAQCLMLL